MKQEIRIRLQLNTTAAWATLPVYSFEVEEGQEDDKAIACAKESEAGGDYFIEARWNYADSSQGHYVSRQRAQLDTPAHLGYKSSLDDITAGDTVVVSTREEKYLAVVERTTKTQIIIGKSRYKRKNGELTNYSSVLIRAPLQKDILGGTAIQRFAEVAHQRREDQIKLPYLRYISNLPERDMRRLEAAALKQAAELLGYVEEK